MDARVLVVGTTPDYVQTIDRIFGNKVLFLTDRLLRVDAIESAPEEPNEVCSDLSDSSQAISDLKTHLDKYALRLNGIACFDCESMELASLTAKEFNLFYQKTQAVKNSRDKSLSRALWAAEGLHTPKQSKLKSIDDSVSFYENIRKPCVLKPVSGAGSELVFLCKNLSEVKERFSFIMKGLSERKDKMLFKTDYPAVLAEEFIDGTEYSCDFTIEDDAVKIIRLTEKIKIRTMPFGIIAGYKLIHQIPNITHKELCATLRKSASAVGINRSICMVDFILKENKIYLIEIAPRPGGDCLPNLLMAATKQNILEINIDYALNKSIKIEDYRKIKELIAFRIFAPKEGILKYIDLAELTKDESVIEINLTSHPGKKIKVPPDDYDSWILGNFIVDKLPARIEASKLYQKLLAKIKVLID